MSDPSAADVYERYLGILNARRFDDLHLVLHDEVTYNGTSLTREQFADARRQDVDTIPDLRYQVLGLLSDGPRLAVRLWFSCTPRLPFRGVDTAGRRVAFAEHVFYELSDGRISAIESIVDVEAVRRQAEER